MPAKHLTKLLVTHTFPRSRRQCLYPSRRSPPASRSPPRSIFFSFGGSAHVHYFGPRAWGAGAGQGQASCALLWWPRVNSVPVWGPGLSAFPIGFLGWGHIVPRGPLLSRYPWSLSPVLLFCCITSICFIFRRRSLVIVVLRVCYLELVRCRRSFRIARGAWNHYLHVVYFAHPHSLVGLGKNMYTLLPKYVVVVRICRNM